jgi:hypothetical protein
MRVSYGLYPGRVTVLLRDTSAKLGRGGLGSAEHRMDYADMNQKDRMPGSRNSIAKCLARELQESFYTKRVGKTDRFARPVRVRTPILEVALAHIFWDTSHLQDHSELCLTALLSPANSGAAITLVVPGRGWSNRPPQNP